MLSNYSKIGWRSLCKRKFYTLLNVSGLALGMACCIFIYLYISYNLSFDTYHPKANATFRVVHEILFDKTEHNKGSSVAIFNALKTEVPQVDQAALSISDQSDVIDVPGTFQKRFKEEKNISFTNSGWFKLFRYTWLAGTPEQLDAPNTVVLTEKLAKKYFASGSAVGQMLMIKGYQLKVVGVLADKPFNTHLRDDMYISLLSFKLLNPQLEATYFTDWTYLMFANNSCVSLKSADQKDAAEKQLNLLAKKHMGEGAKYYHFSLLPVKEIHFDSRYGGYVKKSLLGILAVIAGLIISVAAINYINLVIAQQTRRTIEIGTRKVLGGSSYQLFMQFITESLITSALAVSAALILVFLLLPLVNQRLFADQPIYIISYPHLAVFIAGMLLLITLGAGIYPAFLLSRINVFNALKNKAGNLSAGLGRKILLVFQNIIAQGLMVCTIIMVMQVNYIKNTDKGFNRDFVLTIPLGEAGDLKKEQLSQKLRAIADVQSFTLCNRAPSSESQRGATVLFNNRRDWEKWPARFAIGDTAYCQTFGIKVIAGRNIQPNQPTPEFLVNETMASMLHVKKRDDVIGKSLSAGDIKGVIVGIVQDFNAGSLLQPIAPTVVLEEAGLHRNTLAIKLSGRQSPATLAQIEKQFLNIFPEQVFTYQYVDDQIAALYKQESLQQKLIRIAAGIAIAISSLGLLGLISLITLQRTKEIGIRKVLGASVTRISVLLSKDLLNLSLVSLLMASAFSWRAMNSWLQNYPYRIEIQWWMFALGGAITMLVALLTVGFQTVKAALANPVKSLRAE